MITRHSLTPFSALALALVTGLAAPACDSSSGGPSESPDGATGPDAGTPGLDSGTTEQNLIRSNLVRDTTPDATPADLQALVAGNTAFAVNMYGRMREAQSGGFAFSPFSISSALAMTYAGARTHTEAQMAAALSFTLPQERLHPAFNALDLALASRGSGARGMDGEGFRLHVANAIWGQTGLGFAQSFLDTLAVNYDAGLRALDFAGAAEASRLIINSWVSEQTEAKIPELLGPDNITPGTQLVLTNAVYFNAAWKEVFPEQLTSDGEFHTADGATVTVPTMRNAATFGYASGDGYQAAELLYDGEELSMVLLVPDAGRFAEIEAALGPTITAVVGALAPQDLAVALPRWTIDTRLSVAEPLQALGMTDAFTGEADFSGITGGTSALFISDVIHQTHIAVNEKGTEAAAATAVVMVRGGPPQSLMIDRPFIFVIRDKPTGAILFMGRVLNPAV